MDRSFQFYGTPPPADAMEMESSSSVAAASAFCAAEQSESNYMVGFHQQHNKHIQIDDHDYLLCSELVDEYHDLQIQFCQYSGTSAGRSAIDDDDEEAVLDHHQFQVTNLIE